MPTLLRLLIVEDNVYDAELAVAMLEDADYVCDWVRVETREAYLDRLRSSDYDVILVDYSLPTFDGLTALRLLQAQRRDIPFIFLSGTMGEEIAIESLKAGATDYVLKSRLSRLVPVVQRALQEHAERLERQRAQEALRISNERQLVIFQGAPLAILTFDPLGYVETWNPTAAQLFGWQEEEVRGTPLPFLTPATQDAFWALCDQVLRGETYINMEVRQQQRSGAMIDLSASLAPLRQADGTITGIMALFVDITACKQAEAEQQMLQAQLIQAQKMESVGILAGGIAHDFNNLLTTILGNIYLIRTQVPTLEPVLSYLSDLEDAAERAASLTQQLLIFGRRQVLERRVINLNIVLEDFSRLLQRIIGAHITVHVSLAPDLAFVLADPVQIDQVVMNLAVNARDAMPEGGQLFISTANVMLDTAYCRTHPWIHPGQYVQLMVNDTGSGMDAEILQHIFEPFFTTKAVDKGTGLGLSVVYGIVKEHGGSIHVYSEVGQGTSFKVYFPVVEQTAVPSAPAGALSLPGGTETILVAEDEPMLSQLVRTALTQLGYVVLVAPDGRAALDMFIAHQDTIDLVMLDIMMPQMQGGEVYHAIRALGSTVPVLFTTGYSAEMPQTLLALAADTFFLPKPYAIRELAHKLRDILGAAQP